MLTYLIHLEQNLLKFTYVKINMLTFNTNLTILCIDSFIQNILTTQLLDVFNFVE